MAGSPAGAEPAAPDGSPPVVARTPREIAERLSPWRRRGGSIGLVPTMGALHDGHLSLLAGARRDCDVVVASLFVNPTQFGPNEDFDRYPRDQRRDLELFREHGADVVYAPGVADVYPDGPEVTVAAAPDLAGVLCGAARPGHFDGVATVVSRLFAHCLPDAAYFGEKDYQQLRIVERMAGDLEPPVRVVGMPIVREPDGLAMSSRNAYLSGAQRRTAPALHAALAEAARALRAGASATEIAARGRARLEEAGFDGVDYLDVRDGATLEAAERHRPGLRVFAAARLGRTRLIDNVAAD